MADKFEYALTNKERGELKDNPDSRNKYALLALLRTEGHLLATSEGVVNEGDNKSLYRLDRKSDLCWVPDNILRDVDGIYSRLSKYDWLKIHTESSGKPSAIEVTDPDRLIAHLEKIKTSDLIEKKLKHNIVELKNGQLYRLLEDLLPYAMRNPASKTDDAMQTADRKNELWNHACDFYLEGALLGDFMISNKDIDDLVNAKATGKKVATGYRVGDVLKAMDSDAEIILSQAVKAISMVDTSKADNPAINKEFARWQVEAANAGQGKKGNAFDVLSTHAREVGETTQQLYTELRREQSNEKK